MSEEERELVEPRHWGAKEPDQQQEQRGCQLVEAMFREALERQREQEPRQRWFVESVPCTAIEPSCVEPRPRDEAMPGVPYTELPEAEPGEPLAEEWNTYRRGKWGDGSRRGWKAITCSSREPRFSAFMIPPTRRGK
jgi:hypothetical protein